MSGTVYSHSQYDFGRAAPSYWEASAAPAVFPAFEGAARCHVAVIGGGYAGLSTALHLARDHGVDVRVLEAGHVGWGASGRNGGLCCIGGTKLGIDAMVRRYGLEETRRFYRSQVDGVELVAELAEREGIDCGRAGQGCYEVAHRPARVPELARYGQALTNRLGIAARLYTPEAFLEIGHDGTEQFGALHVRPGFGVHPLALATGMARAAARHGACLHAHSRVRRWRRERGRHVLETDGGPLEARHVVLATNGYTPDDLHAVFAHRTLPFISNIVVTRPLTDAELAAQGWRTATPLVNTRYLLFYYRLLEGVDGERRLLFGARGDAVGDAAGEVRMRGWMSRRLGEVFPAWRAVGIEHSWRGLVCMTRKLAPSVGTLRDDDTVHYGFGWHANGINTATWAGRVIARRIASAAQPPLPAPMAGLPARFPGLGSRRAAVRAAFAWYGLRDRLGW